VVRRLRVGELPVLPSGSGNVLAQRRALPDALALPRLSSARAWDGPRPDGRRAEGVPLKPHRKVVTARSDHRSGYRTGNGTYKVVMGKLLLCRLS
jgi:hypothetical protein